MRDELENKIAVEKLAKPRITEEQLRFFLERFRKMDVTRKSQRKMLIDTFVNAIFLYDDKMVLTYNFHESTETITFWGTARSSPQRVSRFGYEFGY